MDRRLALRLRSENQDVFGTPDFAENNASAIKTPSPTLGMTRLDGVGRIGKTGRFRPSASRPERP
jgi:hypothetical protein